MSAQWVPVRQVASCGVRRSMPGRLMIRTWGPVRDHSLPQQTSKWALYHPHPTRNIFIQHTHTVR